MPKLDLVGAINLTLAQEMEADPRIVILGEDVGVNGGVFRVTDGLQKRFGADRVVDTPLSESGIIGTSIGLAMAGMRPVPEIQFEGFMGPAYDQLVNQAARCRSRTRGAFTCPMTVRVPIGGGIHAPELHSDSPEAVYAHTPGLKVVMPSNPYDTKGLLLAAMRQNDPVIFMEPKRIYRASRGEVPEGEYTIDLGVANVVKPGTQCTVIAWSGMVSICEDAAKLADERGISLEVIDLRSLVPFDLDTVLASVQKTGRCVIVHEAPRTCGFGAELVASIQERAIEYLEAPILRVTGLDTPFPYSLEHEYLPNPERVVGAVQKTLEW